MRKCFVKNLGGVLPLPWTNCLCLSFVCVGIDKIGSCGLCHFYKEVGPVLLVIFLIVEWCSLAGVL